MTRRDMLKSFLGQRSEKPEPAAELPVGNSEPAAPPTEEAPVVPAAALIPAATPVPPRPPAPYVRSGAVGAMGRSLGQIAEAAEAARAMIAAGTSVVEIPTDKLDASFVADRFAGPDGDHARLLASIRESGQQVPILVRPHPDRPDRYQIAYGHRRVRVLAELGRPVRAVVRMLSDADLVVAQGQENSARTDLSHIERARFATTLEDRGFDRAVIMAALNMEKTQLSRLIALGRAIPPEVAQAIGPAPKAGRPRWTAFAERLSDPRARPALDRLLADPNFRTLDSDSRFLQAFAALTRAEPIPAAPDREVAENRAAKDETAAQRLDTRVWRDPQGRSVATLERQARRAILLLEGEAAADFAAFLLDSLAGLHETFLARRMEAASSYGETPDEDTIAGDGA